MSMSITAASSSQPTNDVLATASSFGAGQILALVVMFLPLVLALLLFCFFSRMYGCNPLNWSSRRPIRNGIFSPINSNLGPGGFPLQEIVVLQISVLQDHFPAAIYDPNVVKSEGCAICLEDFSVGSDMNEEQGKGATVDPQPSQIVVISPPAILKETERIRVLPCDHGFHVKCIDLWLTTKSTLCPICKWDCSHLRHNVSHPNRADDHKSAARQDHTHVEGESSQDPDTIPTITLDVNGIPRPHTPNPSASQTALQLLRRIRTYL
ncbi:hypothetical protein BC936DRAFT_145797 [Jimgerdemannia flammicorona]|uniref:Uncharacterized protein n=2 Tax=Jimgerdemannia flammicorona TaxID=994334 RepID=A0A433D981_9FUNG|nr:hypothetical protein BC936DRAFT_145797 [Jimgerdemannia flammicorona]RUS35533.1 hypothetical protein BC938DRAFT_479956 [Jimgerdemannia flammicorona]